MATLCVLAHQDDEMAMATRIAFETRAGRPVFCAVLTDGGAHGARPDERDAESLQVLARLGVPAAQVFFIGSRHGIPDGSLVRDLERVYALLAERVRSVPIDQIFSLAWEGGHADHDAAHVLALALGRERKVSDRVWQFSLYNGRGTPGGFFRVMAPLDVPGKTLRRRITFGEGFRTANLVWRYRSQRSSWLGLFPETFLKLAVLRREIVQETNLDAIRHPPHEGRLYYERRFHVSYDTWRTAAQPFIATHVLDAGAPGAVTDCP